MRITKHHIINPELYLSNLAEGSPFRVVATLEEPFDELLTRAGFPRQPVRRRML